MTVSWHYPRPELARQIADQLTGGLFDRIAYLGRRRIGKTTFLLKDLYPELLRRKALPIYISMWGLKNAPHREILNKLSIALKALQAKNRKGPLMSVLTAEVSRLSVAGATVEFESLQPVVTPDDDLLRIGNLLQEIVAGSDTRVVLLIDEVQHLITAPEFEPLQYKLRTVLDELGDRLSVLYTGSSRKGMEAMFSHPEMPFFNSANQVAFPVLDEGYVAHMARMLEQHYGLAYDQSLLMAFFREVNQAAFWFSRLIKHLALHKCDLNEGVDEMRRMMRETGRLDDLVETLTRLQMAVLIRIWENKSRYDADAKRFYQQCGATDFTRGRIQSALKSLEGRHLVTRVADVLFVEHEGLVNVVQETLNLKRPDQRQ